MTEVSTTVEPEPPGVETFFGLGTPQARAYVALLAGAGIVRGLIGPREADRLWTRHVLNSAVVAPRLPPDAAVVDVGSGAGLPGIPLAIARPDCRLVLVEPLERRCVFLTEAVNALGLTNCRIVRGRAADVIGECGGADVVTSRAVAPLGKLAGWSVPLLRMGGKMLALKGSSAAAEVVRDRLVIEALGLAEVQVLEVGSGVIDPPTFVIHAVRRRAMDRNGVTGRARRPRPPVR